MEKNLSRKSEEILKGTWKKLKQNRNNALSKI